jgi:hypothetical protein
MALKNTITTTISSSLRSVPTLFLSLITLFFTLSLTLFILFSKPHTQITSQTTPQQPHTSIKVYVVDLPRSLNYGLLDQYWSSSAPDSRISAESDGQIAPTNLLKNLQFPPYPENPLIKQYSAEYWITGDLMTPESSRFGSFARRVFDVNEADVVFVPFFATLSAELQLGTAKGAFRKKVGNEDYERQRQVMDLVRGTPAWKRSGGRDFVFVLTGTFGFLFQFWLLVLFMIDFVLWVLDIDGFRVSEC